MDDGTVSGDTITAPPAENPAAVAAREEYARIMSDPTHQHYAGYRRRAPEAENYVTGLYRKAYPETTPVERDRGLSAAASTPADLVPLWGPEQDSSMSLEDRVAQTQVEEMLRQTLGENYESEMGAMRKGAAHLFATPDGQKMLEALAPLITDLGPVAEVRGIRFLAELGSLITQQHGGNHANI